jgi:hypothetical protein
VCTRHLNAFFNSAFQLPITEICQVPVKITASQRYSPNDNCPVSSMLSVFAVELSFYGSTLLSHFCCHVRFGWDEVAVVRPWADVC